MTTLPISSRDGKRKILPYRSVMDVQYHTLPKEHVEYNKHSAMDRKQLLFNVSLMDVLTAPNDDLLDYYYQLLERYYPDSKVRLDFVPNLLSTYGYQEVEPVEKPSSDRIRIGMVTTGAAPYDVLMIHEVLQKIKTKYGKKVELIFFGWNGKLSNQELLKELEFTYYKPVKFLDYFDKLKKLALDIALIPVQNIPFNTHGKSSSKYLEFAVYGIPVIASNIEPYASVVQHQETGFLVENSDEWLEIIGQLIDNDELRKSVGANALKHVWKAFSYTNSTINYLQNVFF